MNRSFNKNICLRRVTPKIIEKLESLGYNIIKQSSNPSCVLIENNNAYVRNFDMSIIRKTRKENCYDCQMNENKFFALAGLTKDTVRNQWFTNEDYSQWEMVDDELPSHFMQLEGHKATAEEIWEYFN